MVFATSSRVLFIASREIILRFRERQDERRVSCVRKGNFELLFQAVWASLPMLFDRPMVGRSPSS